MALQISRSFKDISLSFTRHPITNDISILKNEDAIKKSVMNLVKTQLGERFFNSILGSSVSNSLFELHSDEISIILDTEIKTLLENFEPRVKLLEFSITSTEDAHELEVYISYEIIGQPIPTQNIEFILQPTRV